MGVLQFGQKLEGAARAALKKYPGLTVEYVQQCLERVRLKPDTTTPSFAKLAEFYAELGQGAELKSLTDAFATETKRGAELFTLTYSENGHLVAVLRGVRTDQTSGGVVYDVSVKVPYRRYGLAKWLIESLPGDKRNWNGNPARVIPDLDRGLNGIRTIYGISLTMGFQEVARGTYECFSVLGLAHWREMPLLVLMALTLALLGSRIFWAVGVIRRFVLRSVLNLSPPRRIGMVLFHYPALFTHSFCFFLLCSMYRAAAGAVEARFKPPDHSANALSASVPNDLGGHVLAFSWLYSALLIINAIWLLTLNLEPREKGPPLASVFKWLRSGPIVKGGPEPVWIKNNWCFGIFSAVLAYAGHEFALSEPVLAVSVCSLLLLNSLVDIVRTSWAYSWNDAFSSG